MGYYIPCVLFWLGMFAAPIVFLNPYLLFLPIVSMCLVRLLVN